MIQPRIDEDVEKLGLCFLTFDKERGLAQLNIILFYTATIALLYTPQAREAFVQMGLLEISMEALHKITKLETTRMLIDRKINLPKGLFAEIKIYTVISKFKK